MFEITIKETKDVTKKIGRSWRVIGQKEVPRMPEHITAESPALTIIIDEYGMTPEIDEVETKRETRTVFTQEVDDMDIGKIAAVINGYA